MGQGRLDYGGRTAAAPWLLRHVAKGWQGAQDRISPHLPLCSGRALLPGLISDNFRCFWVLTNFSLSQP